MADDICENYRLIAKRWVDADAAASLLEETKSAFLSQKMLSLGDMPVSRAELIIKGSAEWMEYITKMCQARSDANKLKVHLEWLRLRFQQQSSHEATARSERRL